MKSILIAIGLISLLLLAAVALQFRPAGFTNTCNPQDRYYDATLEIDQVIPEAPPETWELQYDGHYYYGESIIDGVTNVNFSVDAIHNDAPDWPGFCGPLESPGRSGHYTKGDRQYRYIGTETLEGTTVKRYEYVQPTRPNIPRSSDGVEPVRSNHQETLWVNQTGHTVRIDLVLTATYDGAVMQRTEYEARLSGFGEPNIITTPTPEGR